MNNKPKERPIIIPSSEMIRAILEDRKTQHRWPIKLQPIIPFGTKAKTHDLENGKYGFFDENRDYACPYGRPGDRLWVKETWAIDATFGLLTDTSKDFGEFYYELIYKADNTSREIEFKGSVDQNPYLKYYDIQRDGWNSPIYMPKWASRIRLEITNIKVERIQDISIKDILAEGIEHIVNEIQFDTEYKTWLRNEFKKLWDSTYITKGFGWNTNCWVWVIEFRRIGSE